jgi:peptidoglycan/xylan/chitin deacetylase (PgdA/CDA1 family)
MYHDVVPAGAEDASGFPGRDAALYKVTPERFESHVIAIVKRVKQHSPAMTFDDGGVSAMRAADVLERYGLRGEFFVTVSYLDSPGFLTGPQLRELRQRGHVIGSHSCSHPLRMAHCPYNQLLDEWTRSRAALVETLGHNVTAASVPGGDFAAPVAHAAAAAGFTDLFTSEPLPGSHAAFGLTIHGRFTIRRWTSARTAAALASGDRFACVRQRLSWNSKKIGKQLAGGRYLQLRRLLLGNASAVRWGDQR